MPTQIPPEIRGQKYISLTTFRKTGAAVATAVWFGEQDDKLYVMTRSDMGKTKRIRNNSRVRRHSPAAAAGRLRQSAQAHRSQIPDGSADGAVFTRRRVC